MEPAVAEPRDILAPIGSKPGRGSFALNTAQIAAKIRSLQFGAAD